MNHVRIHGDPFGEGAAASLLRSFLRLALGNGMRCSLSLSGVSLRPPAHGERVLALTDGARDLHVGTLLPPAEIELLLRAASVAVAATAPVVVFADRDERADTGRMAGLEWPLAASVLVAGEGATAPDLLERVRAELRWAGCENPPHGLAERDLQSWLALPSNGGDGPVLHVGGDFAAGTDLVVDAFVAHFAADNQGLRLVLPMADDAQFAMLRERLAPFGSAVEMHRGPFDPGHARDARAIVQPWRRLVDSRTLVQALASGRAVCASRFAATAALLGREGNCVPIGGRSVPDEAVEAAHFAPHPRALATAWRKAVADANGAAAVGRRARRHVVENLTRERPAAPPPPVARSMKAPRPVVVLEAPFFETSSSSELSIATARALVRRQAVEVRLVPTVPFRGDIASLRQRAPELDSLFTRSPGTADLWLSSGWPVRAGRPSCRSHALRVDWEYGALPLDLTPHVSQDADFVVVHSEHVVRTIMAAGRPMDSVKLIPHGVDEVMHEHAIPDQRILEWKKGRPALLFCGGPIWRKGFDVFLRCVLDARRAGEDFVVVVKTNGLDQHYVGSNLRELLDRFRHTPNTPPVLCIDDDLTRAELASVYTACDVMLHPYRGEGFCLPILEARACGLPVIATSGGAAKALLEGPGAVMIAASRVPIELPAAHVSQPWVVDPDAADALRALRETLAALPAKRDEARGFAARVRNAYSWDSAASAIEEMAFDALRKNRVTVQPVVAPAVEPVVALPANTPVAAAPEPALR